jgi:hypothetical protein
MKVVAYTDEGDMLLLIPGESVEAAPAEEDSPRGRVLWISKRRLSAPKPLYRLIETNEWTKTEMADEELQQLLVGVTVQGTPIDEPWR